MSCILKTCDRPAQSGISLLSLLCKEHEHALRDKWIREAKAA